MIKQFLLFPIVDEKIDNSDVTITVDDIVCDFKEKTDGICLNYGGLCNPKNCLWHTEELKEYMADCSRLKEVAQKKIDISIGKIIIEGEEQEISYCVEGSSLTNAGGTICINIGNEQYKLEIKTIFGSMNYVDVDDNTEGLLKLEIEEIRKLSLGGKWLKFDIKEIIKKIKEELFLNYYKLYSYLGK